MEDPADGFLIHSTGRIELAPGAWLVVHEQDFLKAIATHASRQLILERAHGRDRRN